MNEQTTHHHFGARAALRRSAELTIRGGGRPQDEHGTDADRENGPAARSFPTGQARGLKAHADAHDCIMVRIQTDLPHTSSRRKDAPQWRAPLGSYADRQCQTPELRRGAPLAVHRPSACSGVKACPGEGRGRCETQAPLVQAVADRYPATMENQIDLSSYFNRISYT